MDGRREKHARSLDGKRRVDLGEYMLLSELARGQAGVVEAVHGEGSVRRHLLDMGLTPNAVVTLQKAAPMGDPIQVTVRGYELTLRLSEADNVLVRALDPHSGRIPECSKCGKCVEACPAKAISIKLLK